MTFCPHCGYNLRADPVLVRGDWRLTPNMAWHGGIPVRLTPAMANILHSLARAYPDPVRTSVLASRSSRGKYSTGSLKVTVSNLRARLGAACPVETVIGFGYRWEDRIAGDAVPGVGF